MEIKFEQTPVHYLRALKSQVQSREETQEIRLSDGMPDIGRILGCWGQCVVRSKEWRSGGMSLSGGVTVWVLYAPEDGSQPQTVEGWVPFQQKWEFDDEGRDGYIWVRPVLKGLDARSVSPRKIMVRANVSTLGHALQGAQESVYEPRDVPQDVQMLCRTYPMDLPVECGEKPVTLEEELTAPAGLQGTPVHWSLTPRITEWKIIGSRLVFKGVADLHLLYIKEGKLQSWDTELSFSQFADLDRDHSAAADAVLCPVMTDLELTVPDGKLFVKAGMVVQFLIYDRVQVELTEDAYSPRRTLELQQQSLVLPARLDHWTVPAEPELSIACEPGTVADVWLLTDIPLCQDGEAVLSGTCQVLYYDPEGNLHGVSGRFEQKISAVQDSEGAVGCIVSLLEKPRIGMDGQGITVLQPMELNFDLISNRGMDTVTGVRLGEIQTPDPNRPSLILCRCKSGDLWELAKAHGSTVDAIRCANGLEGEPEPARMLLIPIA